jgi:hypothetical protein
VVSYVRGEAAIGVLAVGLVLYFSCVVGLLAAASA